MIDYVIWHPDAAAALADPLLARWQVADGVWDAARVIPTVSVYRILGSETVTVPDLGPMVREIRAPLDGNYMVVALDARDAVLDGAPQVLLIADRDTCVILHTITTAEDLATLHVEPVFAGSTYPFGAPLLAA